MLPLHGLLCGILFSCRLMFVVFAVDVCERLHEDTIEGMSLEGYTYQTILTCGYQQCTSMCQRRQDCRSLNYIKHQLLCELNTRSFDDTKTLSKRVGSVFRNMNGSSSQDSDCLKYTCPPFHECHVLHNGNTICTDTRTYGAPSTTTEMSTSTSATPYTTTLEASSSTSAAPSTTTATSTSAAPSTTTETATSSSAAPSTTTETATSTSAAPYTTTETATSTSAAPSTTTETATSTSVAPSTTTETATSTSVAPSTTTETASSTSGALSTTTETATSTSVAPSTTTETATSTSVAPSTTTETASSTSAAPSTTTETATSTSVAPSTTTETATSTSVAPSTTTETASSTSGALSTATIETSTTTSCVQPYLYNGGFGSCLYTSTHEDNWQNAKQYCENMSAILVVAATATQQLALGTLIGPLVGEFWVGASWDSDVGGFAWISGLPLKQETMSSKEGCVKINDGGVLSNGDCGKTLKIICEATADDKR